MSPDSRPVPSRFQRWTDTAHVIVYVGVLAVVTIAALVLAVVAQNKAAAVAQQQAADSRAQQQQLRDVVCDTFTDIGASPLTPDVRPLGRRVIADTKHGAEVAKCPPPRRPVSSP